MSGRRGGYVFLIYEGASGDSALVLDSALHVIDSAGACEASRRHVPGLESVYGAAPATSVSVRTLCRQYLHRGAKQVPTGDLIDRDTPQSDRYYEITQGTAYIILTGYSAMDCRDSALIFDLALNEVDYGPVQRKRREYTPYLRCVYVREWGDALVFEDFCKGDCYDCSLDSQYDGPFCASHYCIFYPGTGTVDLRTVDKAGCFRISVGDSVRVIPLAEAQ